MNLDDSQTHSENNTSNKSSTFVDKKSNLKRKLTKINTNEKIKIKSIPKISNGPGCCKNTMK